ncbi:MAG: hypothetical protein OXI74_05760 [Rhodospirillaceae bacterium]|nr:hypothetical protein [Rhodospirillaceae bacterium]
MTTYSTEDIDHFYMPEEDFENACDSIEQRWMQAGMPHDYRETITDQDEQTVDVHFTHVTGSDGKRYANMKATVVQDGFVILEVNVSAL